MLNRRVAAVAVAMSLLAALAIVVLLDSGSSAPKQAQAEVVNGAAPNPTAVTIADLEAADDAVRQCLADAGYQPIITLPGEGLRETQYTFTGDIRDADAIHKANDIQAGCRTKYSDAVNTAWLKQRGKPTQADLDDLHGRLLSCVAQGGVLRLLDAIHGKGTPPGTAAFVGFSLENNGTDLMDIPHDELDAYSSCALAMEAETGWEAPLPWPSYFDDIKSGKLP